MDPVERVREEFDRAEVAARLGRPGDETELWDVERRALEGRLAPGSLVLDVGCGEGREAIALSRRSCRVVAGDLSQGMVDRARAAVERRVRLVRFDARRLPFRPGAFDAVVLTNMLLQYVWPRAARVEVAREARRVLAPGGLAFFHLSIWPLAEDLLGCRAPVPVRRGLRLLFGATILAVNLLTDLFRTLFRTRLEPGDRWTGRGVLAFFHMHSRAEFAREVEEAGFVARDWHLDGDPGPVRERWNGLGAVLVAARTAGQAGLLAGEAGVPDGKA